MTTKTTTSQAAADYVAARLTTHMAGDLATRAAAERTAGALARRHPELDLAALEAQAMAAVYAALTEDDLQHMLRDPSTRREARAELTRRTQA